MTFERQDKIVQKFSENELICDYYSTVFSFLKYHSKIFRELF